MATTANQGLPYPALTDSPNGPTQMQALAQAVETKLVMVFADATTRDQKISAPVAGMLAYLTNPGVYVWYNGSSWVPLGIITQPAFVSVSPGLDISAGNSNSQTFNITVPPLTSTITGSVTFDVSVNFSNAAGGSTECHVFIDGGTVGNVQFWNVFPSASQTERTSITIPFQKSISAGSHTVICRVVNHNPNNGAACHYYSAAFTGFYS